MIYTVEILRSAQKQLERLAGEDHPRIISAIRSLAHDPRPTGSKKLTGRSAWRIRVGPYRILYEIHDTKLLVLVVMIGHRKEVYR